MSLLVRDFEIDRELNVVSSEIKRLENNLLIEKTCQTPLCKKYREIRVNRAQTALDAEIQKQQNLINEKLTNQTKTITIQNDTVNNLLRKLRELEAARIKIPSGFLSSSSASRRDADNRAKLRNSLDIQIRDITEKLKIAVKKAEFEQELTTQDALKEKQQTQQTQGINPLIILGGLAFLIL